MNYWKYMLITDTGVCVRSEGFFETEADAIEGAKKYLDSLADPGKYKVETGQHWGEVDADAFEDEAFCDYSDTMESAIIALLIAITGREPDPENSVEAFDLVREELAEHFHGCYPANVTLEDPETGENEDVPCACGVCEYGCRCPVLNSETFPEFDPEANDVDSIATELIRCVKCNMEYVPSREDIDAAVQIVCTKHF